MVADNLRYDYMNSMYTVDIDEWPPYQPRTVVNVALMYYKGSRTEKELIEISRRHEEGTHAVDMLALHSGVTKDISRIFTAEAGTKSPKFILIEGAPGTGKTMLAKRIEYLWAKQELLRDVDILFLLFLQDPQLQNVTTLKQLIQYFSSKDLNEEQLKNCLHQIEGLKVGIVMDGFDEYPIKLHKKSFIADLIKGKVFHNSIVVLTSRPTATISLHDIVDRRVEILGFAQEERDKYIYESLDSPEQRMQLQHHLRCQPILNSLTYVPLHLAILVYLFKAQSKLPDTLTEINESFIIHTVYRSLTKHDHGLASTTVVHSINDFPTDVTNIVKGLSKLAFLGLHSDKLVFSYDEVIVICPEIKNDIPGPFNGFGLLQVVQHFPERGSGTTVSFNFQHFTMQVYLAAFYVSTMIPYEQQLYLMEETFWSNKYNLMWIMYAGINGINSQIFLQFLYKAKLGIDVTKLMLSSSIQSDKLKCLHLFQCFMEAKSATVPKEISSVFCNNKINFHNLKLLPHHISSLILYISKYAIQLELLNLRNCNIGDVGMSILEQFFTANPDKASSIKHIDLFGNNSVLLWNVYCAIFGRQNLTELNWSSLGGVNIEEIVNVMDNNMTVQSLNLSHNQFNDDDAKRIAKVLSTNTTLQELDFSCNNITTKGAFAISVCLQCNVALQRLNISWNSRTMNTNNSSVAFSQNLIKDVDVGIITNILHNNKTVSTLDLSQNIISDNGTDSISQCIRNNGSLKEINISRNKISNIGLIKIASALKHNQTLHQLNVSRNNISDDGALAISECLQNNNTLQELNLSHNKISVHGIITISKALMTNVTLQILDISHNNVSNDGAIAFSDCLAKNNTLCELHFSWNDPIKEVISKFGEALAVNTGLHTLDLSSQEVDDPFHFTMILLTAMYHNVTMTRLVVPLSEVKNEAAIRNVVDNLNEERIKKNVKILTMGNTL